MATENAGNAPRSKSGAGIEQPVARGIDEYPLSTGS